MADNNEISAAFDAIFETSAETQEVAEPVEEQTEYADGDGEETAEEQEATEPAGEQSAEMDAKFAAMRRKHEQELAQARAEAEEAMKQTMAKEYGAVFGALDLFNPYTGKKVESPEEFTEYVKVISEDKNKQIEEKLDSSDITKEELNAYINSHPDVVKAREANERLSVLERKMQQEADTKYLASELEEIQKFDPTIKGFEDIVNDPHHDQFKEMVDRGYRISDAYLLIHKDDILTRQAEMSRQETLNTMRGKEHLKKSSPHGDGDYVATAEEIAEYQKLNPGKSAEDIRKFIARDRKRMGK